MAWIRGKLTKSRVLVWVMRLAIVTLMQLILYYSAGHKDFSLYVQIFMHLISVLITYLGAKMNVIGLTGGIACGKSTVVRILA